MKFYIHKLGCPKNDVDADYIAARLIDAGHEPVCDPLAADSIIVNTCGFILPAKEESITEILRLGQLKKEGRLRALFASGCLSQRYGDELLKEIPELDGAFGHGALDSLAAAVDGAPRFDRAVRVEPRRLAYLDWRDRFISDPYPWAYLKISDGCDRGCTFCAIPGMRGRFRSRPLESILREARFLADRGKRELILVSQEATLWGYDLPGRPDILSLLRALDGLAGVRWIRLMYLYPAALTTELIKYLADDGNKALDYFDLPLQHISDDILRAMRRRGDRRAIESQLRAIREIAPGGTVRTTLIVGFPGETERHFAELREFVERFEFDRLGVFAYSPEEGTPAAEYPGQVPERIRQRRVDDLMTVQQEIAFAKNNSLIGRILEVIIDSAPADGPAVGRTRGDCPEIDQEISVCGERLAAGTFCRVRVEAADGYDLRGCTVGVVA